MCFGVNCASRNVAQFGSGCNCVSSCRWDIAWWAMAMIVKFLPHYSHRSDTRYTIFLVKLFTCNCSSSTSSIHFDIQTPFFTITYSCVLWQAERTKFITDASEASSFIDKPTPTLGLVFICVNAWRKHGANKEWKELKVLIKYRLVPHLSAQRESQMFFKRNSETCFAAKPRNWRNQHEKSANTKWNRARVSSNFDREFSILCDFFRL